MKPTLASLICGVVILGALSAALAANLKDKVKVEVESVGLHPGMDPGMYVCAEGHLHIKATVQNLAGLPLGRIKVAGQAFDADGKLRGTAMASTKEDTLGPGEKAPIDLEFLTVTGPVIQIIKKHKLTVIEAPPKQ